MDLLPFELIRVISSFQDNISDVSKLRRTCKQFLKLELTPRSNDNSMLILLQLYPNKFNMKRISASRHITWNIVCKYPEYEWNIQRLSSNPNITMDIIRSHPEMPWCYYTMSSNPNIDIEYVVEHLDDKQNVDSDSLFGDVVQKISFMLVSFVGGTKKPKLGWDFIELSSNPGIRPEHVKKYPNLPWKHNQLNINPNFHVSDLQDIGAFSADIYVKNPNIHESDIISLLEYYPKDSNIWKQIDISKLSIQFVLDHEDINWNWDRVSFLPGVNKGHVEKHPDKDWNKVYFELNIEGIDPHQHHAYFMSAFPYLSYKDCEMNMRTRICKNIDDVLNSQKTISNVNVRKYVLFTLLLMYIYSKFTPITDIIESFINVEYEGYKFINNTIIKDHLCKRSDMNWNIIKSYPQIEWDFDTMFEIGQGITSIFDINMVTKLVIPDILLNNVN